MEAVQSVETNKEFQEAGLLGIDAVKELILDRNQDLIPFQKYVSNKYGNARIQRSTSSVSVRSSS